MRVHTALCIFLTLLLAPAAANCAEPLKAIYLTSPGIYHDYAYQAQAITGAIASRVNVIFDISLSETGDWKRSNYGEGYDVIIYNICDADNTDSSLIANMRRQTEVLQVPAMVIHCSMHSFRNTQEWWPLYGLKTVAHEAIGEMPQKHAADHPILTGIPKDWTVAHDELYINLAFKAKPLLTSPADNGDAHVTAWTDDANGTRVFGTTLGHSNETMDDPVFQQLLVNGLLWVSGNLERDGSVTDRATATSDREAIASVSKAEGVDYLTEEQRTCMQLEMGKAVLPCYLGCIFNPLLWGEEAAACRQDCNALIPESQVLMQACVE